jgi:cytochrome c peroxidase
MKSSLVYILLFIGLSLSLALSKPRWNPFVDIPPHFPELPIPEENQLSKARIELGRRLFYDPILSRDSTISCSSCHQQAFAFADNLPISPGVDGRMAERNAPSLANVGYQPTLLFDGFLKTLEQQVLVPIEEHAEMDFNIVLIGRRLEKNKRYVRLAQKAYNRAPDYYVITRAISSFQRTLISGNSKYDQSLSGKVKLTVSEERGRKLFFDELYCGKCHKGVLFTNFETENNGLMVHYTDSGRMRATKLELDRDKFKVPSLRNIALTAPYMHDGSLPDLKSVIRHYANGGKANPQKNPIIESFLLTDQMETDLIAFLGSLTDYSFLKNKKYSEMKKI